MDGLLEYLTYKTGSTYMSDLTYCQRMLPGAIWNIPENKYSTSEWSEAIDYIYRVEKRFRTVKDAKEFIYYHRLEIK